MSTGRIINALSAETQLVVNRLKKADVNQIVAYDELSEILGYDIRDKGRDCIRSAKRLMLRDYNAWFATVKGVGLLRCNDSNALVAGMSARKRVQNAAKQGIAILVKGCKYEQLSQEEQTQYNAHLSVLGAVKHFAGSKAIDAIEAKVTPSTGRLSIGQTIDALKDIG